MITNINVTFNKESISLLNDLIWNTYFTKKVSQYISEIVYSSIIDSNNLRGYQHTEIIDSLKEKISNEIIDPFITTFLIDNIIFKKENKIDELLFIAEIDNKLPTIFSNYSEYLKKSYPLSLKVVE